MRVVSESDKELVLEHRPIVLPGLAGILVIAVVIQTLSSAGTLNLESWIGACAGIGVGGFITYLMALPSQVVFDGKQREVRWHHGGWPGRGKGHCSLDTITGVQVLTETPNPGPERIALMTTTGVTPLLRHYSGVEPHLQTAAIIRDWLRRQGLVIPAD